MTLNDLQRAALVLFAAREAGPGGSLDQMMAVCHVIRNRMAAGWADNCLEVIADAELSRGNAEGAGRRMEVKDRALGMLARDIDEIFYGHADDEVARICGRQDKERGPLLYWYFIDRPVTEWFVTNIIRKPEEHRHRGILGLMYLYE
jgi:hypothetical protein